MIIRGSFIIIVCAALQSRLASPRSNQTSSTLYQMPAETLMNIIIYWYLMLQWPHAVIKTLYIIVRWRQSIHLITHTSDTSVLSTILTRSNYKLDSIVQIWLQVHVLFRVLKYILLWQIQLYSSTRTMIFFQYFSDYYNKDMIIQWSGCTCITYNSTLL